MRLRIYLAARYSRRLELCGYKKDLQAIGHEVISRWLLGGHQMGGDGTPIGDQGESLVEDENTHDKSAELRLKFANDDLEDVSRSDLLIAFTEPPESVHGKRGGRHVELGIAIGKNIPIIVVGYRENVFCWLEQIRFFPTWKEVLEHLKMIDEDAWFVAVNAFRTGWNALAKEAHKTAKEHGFWEPSQDNKGQKIALMHSELSEVLEAVRKPSIVESSKIPPFTEEEEELADLLIRVMDYAEHHQLDVANAVAAKMRHNRSRPSKHNKLF
jgi:NTP pyrophosphatase (non-canonical NTP hydrolase)